MTYEEYIRYHRRGDAGVEERMIASLCRALNLRWLWNNPQAGQSPYTLFEGALVPQGKDADGNLVYKYNGATF
jgi:hypothetical protein